MANLAIGYLLKKREISYNEQDMKIFEFLDYVVGIEFVNTQEKTLFNIASGTNAGEMAYVADSEDIRDGSYIFLEEPLMNAIKQADNKVDFNRIRAFKKEHTAKYFEESEDGKSLLAIKNKKLISYLDKMNTKRSDFDEEELKRDSNISTMYSKIKETIVAQDDQIMRILTSLYKNQAVVNSELDLDIITKLKENIIVFGATGTGKTEILKRIASLYHVPIVIEDATSLSEVGYRGREVADMLESLYLAAGKDIELAQKGILVIDEIDKLAEKGNEDHVSRIGVQKSLLKLLDGSPLYFKEQQFDTSRLSIVALGAFTGITEGDDYSNVKEDDFIKYGVMRELMARFPKHVAMSPLSKDDLIRILIESNFSPLNTYRLLFEYLNMSYSYSNDYVEYIADRAIETQSGARSLKNIVDEEIGSAMFRVFAGEYSSIHLVKPEKESGRSYILKK